jgi:hypothetical protein
MACAIGYIPPESAWRIAAVSLTGELDAYLAAIGQVAAADDEFLDFSIPSARTEGKDGTYDGFALFASGQRANPGWPPCERERHRRRLAPGRCGSDHRALPPPPA